MKKLFIICIICLSISIIPTTAFSANSGVSASDFWYTQNYSLTEIDGGIVATGTSKYSYKCSTSSKIDIEGYSLKLDLDYDFSKASLDWIAFVFAPVKTPFVNSGAAVSLLLRPRGNELIISIMTNSFIEVTQSKIARTDGDIYDISSKITEKTLTFCVNEKEITTDNSAINYSLLSRGAYNSFAVNGGTGYEENLFTLTLTDMNITIHDSSKDKIIYGSTISLKDENIADLLSENFSLSEKEVDGTTLKTGTVIIIVVASLVAACGIIWGTLAIVKKKKH